MRQNLRLLPLTVAALATLTLTACSGTSNDSSAEQGTSSAAATNPASAPDTSAASDASASENGSGTASPNCPDGFADWLPQLSTDALEFDFDVDPDLPAPIANLEGACAFEQVDASLDGLEIHQNIVVAPGDAGAFTQLTTALADAGFVCEDDGYGGKTCNDESAGWLVSPAAPETGANLDSFFFRPPAGTAFFGSTPDSTWIKIAAAGPNAHRTVG